MQQVPRIANDATHLFLSQEQIGVLKDIEESNKAEYRHSSDSTAYAASIVVGPDGTLAGGLGGSGGSTGGDETPTGMPVQIQVSAVNGLPVVAASGDLITPTYDLFGRALIAGYNQAANAIDVSIINQASLSRMGPVTTIPQRTEVGPGDWINVTGYKNFTCHILAGGVTIGATIKLESTIDGLNFAAIDGAEEVITASGNYEITVDNKVYTKIRATITDYTDGVYTSMVYAGN